MISNDEGNATPYKIRGFNDELAPTKSVDEQPQVREVPEQTICDDMFDTSDPLDDIFASSRNAVSLDAPACMQDERGAERQRAGGESQRPDGERERPAGRPKRPGGAEGGQEPLDEGRLPAEGLLRAKDGMQDERDPGSAASGAAGHSARRPPPALKVSAARISRRFVASLPSASPRGYLAYSVTFTERSGQPRVLRHQARRFIVRFLAAHPEGGAVLALDRGAKNGHWHLHGIAILRQPVDWRHYPDEDRRERAEQWASILRRTWLRLWPRRKGAGRPVSDAQRVRFLSEGFGQRRVLTAILKHALDRHSEDAGRAAGDASFRMPILLRRVLIGGVSYRKAFREAVRGRTKPTKPHSRRRRSAEPGCRCGWCGERLPALVRGDTRYHDRCARKAGRALGVVLHRTQPLVQGWLDGLRAQARTSLYGEPARAGFDLDEFMEHDPAAGWHVKAWLAVLEKKKAWLRLDALRVIEAAIRLGIWPTANPGMSPRLAAALECKGGRPKVRRLNAVTCGQAACKKCRRRPSRPARRRKFNAPAALEVKP